MKTLIVTCLITIGVFFNSSAQKLAPYIKVGESSKTVEQVSEEIQKTLITNSFEILGTYNPEGKSNLKVIVFTNDKLKNTVVKINDRGALAAAVKVGIIQKDGKTTVSYTNPDYILRAYLRDNYDSFQATFQQFSKDVKIAFEAVGSEFKPFGGAIEQRKLKDYHYKIMMPYFTDPISLNEFPSFEEGMRIIENNLTAQKGYSKEVYRIVYPDQKIAVFGIGLASTDDGEQVFLPIIGEEHIAAMPYEIILQDKEVTMLHGKYRIALHWPELTMGTFMKIMSTPGDIEDTLKEICIQ
jgi:uncharacterized protein (DUF302 family)